MNNLDKEFDEFIDSLPQRVGETPREKLREFINFREEKLLKGVEEYVQGLKDTGKYPSPPYPPETRLKVDGWNTAIIEFLSYLKEKRNE